MSLKYRADINGLRAIAVLLVVLYHAKFPIPGGFVGVDVFFVISGFLITGIIDKEIRTARFTYVSFYVRRIKRLIPALFFMLIFVSAYCSYYLMPDDLLSYGKTVVLSLLGVSNFYFYSHTNYFESSSLEPLLHTWSLAVEEQYYIFWPVILMGIYKARRASVKTLSFSFLFMASVILSWYYVHQDKNLAYMMLPFRFFELMTGALLAINYRRTGAISKYNNALSVTGILLILASAFFLNDNSPFPGVLALPVTIGTAMLIASRDGIVNKFISLKPVVYIGRVSYSFYLWHWPVIILASYRGIELSHINAAALVLASFAAACISYHFIENPFRKFNSPRLVFPMLYAVPLCCACLFMIYMNETSGMKSRMEGIFDELSDDNSAHIHRPECMEKMKIGNFNECWLGVKKSKPDILMIGDSFGNAYTPFIDVLAKDAGVMVTDTMRSSTPSIPGIFVEKDNQHTSKFNATQIAYYNTHRTKYAYEVGTVIISDFFDRYTKGYKIYDGKRNDYTDKSYNLRVYYLRNLVKAGVKVFIIARPFDSIGTDGIAKLRLEKMKHAINNSVTFPYGMSKYSREEYKLKKDVPQITIIDPNDYLCSHEKCQAVIDGDIIFRPDGTHLNYTSARNLGNKYLRTLGNPLKIKR